MIIQSYLLLVTTQPLLLRLSMVAVLVTVFLAANALAERVLDSRPQSARNVLRQAPRKVIYVPLFF
jgi:hypothetical protein